MSAISAKTLKDFCKGKKRAFDKIYHAYSPGMYAIALRYMKDEDEAKDVLQNSFIKLYNSRDKFDPSGSIGAYIKRITINTALDELRKKKKFEPIENNLILSEDEVDFEIEENNKQSYEQLLGFIQDLPDGYRTVFNLFVFENLKHTEIAEYLDISVNTSKSQLMKAKRMLKEKLSSLVNAERA
ncbi:RNA polymerase sigma-70 factor, ECF subfamily [Lishizhenia tianjinensis]|uniref:RNA polymerase sigma-70 factor, ECF subfamily n=1 Tax=Lishizhenia tianjinensis TaxID=477690 RepID=A0A1I6YGA8_9FLAO|nr:sigma-70 family RNA polymerase sigma factor [Lishizhenia tianjinensis]SFT49575.1 RNA polymerase sigma-70 factor, ECF subfamily [Lishizhenia tianjinensis]